MKRFALAGCLLFAALPAQAAGTALRWGSCEGTANRNFACDRATGSELLVGSFSPPGGVDALSGMEVYMRITTAGTTMPSWWQMIWPGACRQSSISSRFDVSDETECDDAWQGQAAGGVARYRLDGSSGIELWMAAAVPQAAVRSVSSGRTYAAFKLVINHQRSSGPGSCGGCDAAACIQIERMVLTQAAPRDPRTGITPQRNVELTSGISGMGGTANFATWQGGTPSCAAGAPKPSTWSQVKDKYRPR